jgi:hypothetical protein
MNYAFLDIAQEYQLDAVRKFLNRTGSKLSYINTAVEGNFHGNISHCIQKVTKLKESFPKGQFDSLNDFLYPDVYSAFIHTDWVLSEQDILDCKHIESMSIRLMDRSALIPTSAFSRRRMYLLLLNYFSFLIDSKDIQGVVVFDTPHSFFTHVMYELCKLKGLKVLKLEYHFLTEYSVLLNQDEWPALPTEYAQNESTESLLLKLPKNLSDSIFKNSEILEEYKNKETKAIVKQSPFSSLKLYIRFVIKGIKNLIMGFFPFLFKNEVLHFASLNGIKNRLYYRIILTRQLFKLIKLNVKYNKLANSNISLNQNYVFVGLHMQPEKTSQPMGGEFDNQLMMIKVLSDSIPEGWKVYVKDHPNQFNVRKVPNRHYRNELFYKCIDELPNVEIVPLEIDSEVLIQNAQLVATLTGTLGWEAITKNVPALVFGNTYYMSCRAARKVTSVESCKLAIQELCDMKDTDIKREIVRYISYYHEQKWLIQTANWQTNFTKNSISYEQQIENIVDRMNFFHNQF